MSWPEQLRVDLRVPAGTEAAAGAFRLAAIDAARHGREGTGWLYRVLTRIERGEGRPGDLEVLQDAAVHMAGRTICALADGAAAPVLSVIKNFPETVRAGIQEKAA